MECEFAEQLLLLPGRSLFQSSHDLGVGVLLRTFAREPRGVIDGSGRQVTYLAVLNKLTGKWCAGVFS